MNNKLRYVGFDVHTEWIVKALADSDRASSARGPPPGLSFNRDCHSSASRASIMDYRNRDDTMRPVT